MADVRCVLQTITIVALLMMRSVSCIYRALSFRSYCLESSRPSKLTNERQINSSRTKTSTRTKLARTGKDGKSEWEASRSEKRRVRKEQEWRKKECMYVKQGREDEEKCDCRRKVCSYRVSRFSKNSSTFQLQNAPHFWNWNTPSLIRFVEFLAFECHSLLFSILSFAINFKSRIIHRLIFARISLFEDMSNMYITWLMQTNFLDKYCSFNFYFFQLFLPVYVLTFLYV